MQAGFAQFAAFDQDATDNSAWLAARNGLAIPVYAIGGETSFGPMMATVMRFAASDADPADLLANLEHSPLANGRAA